MLQRDIAAGARVIFRDRTRDALAGDASAREIVRRLMADGWLSAGEEYTVKKVLVEERGHPKRERVDVYLVHIPTLRLSGDFFDKLATAAAAN